MQKKEKIIIGIKKGKKIKPLGLVIIKMKKCPLCNNYMSKINDEWHCINDKCRYREKNNES